MSEMNNEASITIETLLHHNYVYKGSSVGTHSHPQHLCACELVRIVYDIVFMKLPLRVLQMGQTRK